MGDLCGVNPVGLLQLRLLVLISQYEDIFTQRKAGLCVRARLRVRFH